jgi:hypothetical protein
VIEGMGKIVRKVCDSLQKLREEDLGHALANDEAASIIREWYTLGATLFGFLCRVRS